MLNIKLNEKYTLKSDPLNVWIEENVQTEKGSEYAKVFGGYYSNIEQALRGYARRKINLLEADTVDKLIEGINGINEEIKSFCESIKGAVSNV